MRAILDRSDATTQYILAEATATGDPRLTIECLMRLTPTQVASLDDEAKSAVRGLVERVQARRRRVLEAGDAVA